MDEKNGFENLEVWQYSHQLTLAIYRITKSFPVEERYGLISQLRRSASSVPTNIVEGRGRFTRKEFINFLYIARGSLEETKYHLILARDLEYLPHSDFEALMNKCKKVGRMINGLIGSQIELNKKH